MVGFFSYYLNHCTINNLAKINKNLVKCKKLKIQIKTMQRKLLIVSKKLTSMTKILDRVAWIVMNNYSRNWSVSQCKEILLFIFFWLFCMCKCTRCDNKMGVFYIINHLAFALLFSWIQYSFKHNKISQNARLINQYEIAQKSYD